MDNMLKVFHCKTSKFPSPTLPTHADPAHRDLIEVTRTCYMVMQYRT